MSLRLINFDVMQKITDVRGFKKRLRKHVKAATIANGTVARKAMKEAIKTGKYAPNNKITTQMKGSSTPLMERGNSGGLVSAIAKRTLRWNEAHIGIMKSSPQFGTSGKPKDMLGIAYLLHEGTGPGSTGGYQRQRVTVQMRKFFYLRSLTDPRFSPIGATTEYIVIPPRPFLEGATTDAAVAIYERNWGEAIQKALNGIP